MTNIDKNNQHKRILNPNEGGKGTQQRQSQGKEDEQRKLQKESDIRRNDVGMDKKNRDKEE